MAHPLHKTLPVIFIPIINAGLTSDATGHLQSIQAKHDQQQARVVELEKQLATALERISNSTVSSAGLERRIEELQQEQLHWEGENRRLQETISVLEKGLPKMPPS